MLTEHASSVLPDLQMAINVPGIVWPAVPGNRQAHVLALLFQMESVQWLSGEAIRARQSIQLNVLLEHARRECRFYRSRLPADNSSWNSLPLLTRRDLQVNFDDLVATNYPKAHGRSFELSSGGSTGEPVKVKRSLLTQLFWEASTLRDHLWHRRDFSKSMAIIRNFETPPDQSQHKQWGHSVFRTGPAWHMPVSTDIERQLDWLQSVNPEILLTYPPNLAMLMSAMIRKKISLPRLSEVRTISGTVSEALRQDCQSLLGVPLVDLYSTQEVGIIGIQCPASGLLHLQSENLLVEILDTHGRPCEEGEVGQVVVTDLHNFAMPLIRYALRDWAEQGPVCPCGRGLPTIRSVKGRNRNMAYTPDGKQFWPVLGVALFRQLLPNLRQYQLVQTACNAITVKLVCIPSPSTAQMSELQSLLERTLGHTYHWTWHITEKELPLSGSGKFEEFVCLVNENT